MTACRVVGLSQGSKNHHLGVFEEWRLAEVVGYGSKRKVDPKTGSGRSLPADAERIR